MKTHGLVVLLLSGCLLVCDLRSAGALRRYHRVDEIMNWPDARRHCREKFTDLATIEDGVRNAEAEQAGGGRVKLWIGLHNSTWGWSSGAQLKPNIFYTNWASEQPSFWRCVMMAGSGLWYSRQCADKHYFLCNNGLAGSDVLVQTLLSWTDARAHCRRHYKDLSVIDKEEENRQLQLMLNSNHTTNPHGFTGGTGGHLGQNQDDRYQYNPKTSAWFGLFRPIWKWSDGSTAPYRRWKAVQPQKAAACVVMDSTPPEWIQRSCVNKYAFLCYSEVNVSMVRAVRLRLSSSAAPTQWAEPESVLQQVRQKLVERGVREDVKLSWRRQLDGRVFNREQEEEEQSASC